MRNVSDGSVEVFAIGNAGLLEAFARDIGIDTPGGVSVMRIERRELAEGELDGLGLKSYYSGFEVGTTRSAD